MKLFLTSNPGGVEMIGDHYEPCVLDNRNQFVDHLRAALPEKIHCLLISSDPINQPMNDSVHEMMSKAFALTGFVVAKMVMCDGQNQDQIAEFIKTADLIILCGGHVPTQNQFFAELQLKERLAGYDGVIVGISAGTMNCAEIVYAQPELDGEAADPEYQRYLKGLGLTKIRVLPHFEDLQGQQLDGYRIIEDIAIPDSKIHPFYALVDGAYIYVTDGHAYLYGDTTYFSDGRMEHICSDGEVKELDI